MKKASGARLPEGHLDRYDWSRAKRGRLAPRARKVTALLRILEPDLAVRFPDSRSVNEALRALLALEAALPKPSAAAARLEFRGDELADKLVPVIGLAQPPTDGIESPRQILSARRSGISVWRGTA
jgi:hypothetical protein